MTLFDRNQLLTNTLQMKNLFLKITLVLLPVFFISCGSESKLRISTSEDLEKVKALAIEQFGEDIEIYELGLTQGEDLSNDLGSIDIWYHKDDKKKYSNAYNVQTYGDAPNLRGEKLHESTTKFIPKWDRPENKGKLKIKDIDFDKILVDLETALDQIEDLGTWSLKSYTSKVAPKTNRLTSRFTVQITPSENATNLEGRNIVTNYYEYTFEVNEEGELLVKD